MERVWKERRTRVSEGLLVMTCVQRGNCQSEGSHKGKARGWLPPQRRAEGNWCAGKSQGSTDEKSMLVR